MTTEELLAFLKGRQGILDGVCITGGEPTLHPELPDLIRRIRELGLRVKLDTNGYRPQVLEALVGEGLVDYVAMDVKNSPDRYAQTVELEDFRLENIQQSLSILIAGSVDFELRTTVVEPLHDEKSIADMAHWLDRLTGGHKIQRFFVQPFVDRETVPVAGLSAPNDEMLAKYVKILGLCAEKAEVRGK